MKRVSVTMATVLCTMTATRVVVFAVTGVTTVVWTRWLAVLSSVVRTGTVSATTRPVLAVCATHCGKVNTHNGVHYLVL